MSEADPEEENFLRRWSQRKRAAANRERNDDATPDSAKTDAPPGNATATPPEPQAFDPKTLPPIESITANSDIRAFLAPGVPLELSRAALRRAWASDPAIRDFIGIAENQWDFTKPDSVPGFGSLEWTPELRQLLARLVGDTPSDLAQPPQTTPPNEQATESSLPAPPAPSGAAAMTEDLPPRISPQDGGNAAVQTETRDADADAPSAARKHGGALPKLADTRRY